MKTGPSIPRWVLVLILLCCLVEAALILAPMLGYAPARQVAYLLGAFWSPAVSAGGIYPLQPYTMFLTYGVLHVGISHLLTNMLSLAVISRELSGFIGSRMMALAYLITQIAAAGMYALMEPYGGPVVGASGAIYGLAGVLISQAYRWWRHEGGSIRTIWRTVLITGAAVLIAGALNFAITRLLLQQEPTIAWQAHLGGFIAGVIIGLILPAAKSLTEPRKD